MKISTLLVLIVCFVNVGFSQDKSVEIESANAKKIALSENLNNDSMVEKIYVDSLGNLYKMITYQNGNPIEDSIRAAQFFKQLHETQNANIPDYGHSKHFELVPKNRAPFFPREGTHLFALHWIGYSSFGHVLIKRKSSKSYTIKGIQKNDAGDYVSIDGLLTPINKGTIAFDGLLVTKYKNSFEGLPCIKNGKYTFYSKPGRKYWRLQEMDSCGEEGRVDYVDIFF